MPYKDKHFLKEYDRLRYQQHKEEKQEYDKKRYLENKDIILVRQKKYRELCKYCTCLQKL